MKNFLYAVFTFAALALASCGGDSCDADSVSESLNKFSAAFEAYAADETQENCEEYKSALQDYINEVKDCDFVTQEEVDEAQDSLDNLDCDQ